ncbi:hypothetical protein EE612_022681 [Oryza sativa]|nr:hypothetical protein EE612_022681 [Oryza sativa]
MSGYGGASLGAAESRQRRGSAQRQVGADPVPAAPSRTTTMAPGGAAIPSSPSLLPSSPPGGTLPPPAAPPHADLAPRVAGATDPMPATTVGQRGRRIQFGRRRQVTGATDLVAATTAGSGGDESGASDGSGGRWRRKWLASLGCGAAACG